MIVIAGGTGFLGRPLVASLAAGGHAVTVLTRHRDDRRGNLPASPPRAASGSIVQVEWHPDGTTGPWMRAIDGADGVVNLAGESIAARRWTASQKARLVESRLLATKSLVDAIAAAASPP